MRHSPIGSVVTPSSLPNLTVNKNDEPGPAPASQQQLCSTPAPIQNSNQWQKHSRAPSEFWGTGRAAPRRGATCPPTFPRSRLSARSSRTRSITMSPPSTCGLPYQVSSLLGLIVLQKHHGILESSEGATGVSVYFCYCAFVDTHFQTIHFVLIFWQIWSFSWYLGDLSLISQVANNSSNLMVLPQERHCCPSI